MNLEPVVHPTRNTPVAVEFTDEYVMIGLTDGRILGMPLYFFPWLQGANEAQRQDYQLYGCSVYWEEIDEGIDITAMVSGLYITPKERPETAPLRQATST